MPAPTVSTAGYVEDTDVVAGDDGGLSDEALAKSDVGADGVLFHLLEFSCL